MYSCPKRVAHHQESELSVLSVKPGLWHREEWINTDFLLYEIKNSSQVRRSSMNCLDRHPMSFCFHQIRQGAQKGAAYWNNRSTKWQKTRTILMRFFVARLCCNSELIMRFPFSSLAGGAEPLFPCSLAQYPEIRREWWVLLFFQEPGAISLHQPLFGS